MNVSQISGNLAYIWIYFAIAIPLTILSFIVVGKWASLVKAWSYLFKKDNHDYSATRIQRWKKLMTATFRYIWLVFPITTQRFQTSFRRFWDCVFRGESMLAELKE